MTDDDTIFELAASAMQAQHGEYKRSGLLRFTDNLLMFTDSLLTFTEHLLKLY